MTYAQVAKRSDIPEVSIIRIFTEKRAVNFAQAASIAEAMDTTVQAIVEEAERESLRRFGTPYGFTEPRNLSELRARVESGQVGDVAALDPGYSPEDEQEPESP